MPNSLLMRQQNKMTTPPSPRQLGDVHLQSVLRCIDEFQACPKPADVSALLVLKAQSLFMPACAALLSWDAEKFVVESFSSQDESAARKLETSLANPDGMLQKTLRQVLFENLRGSHRLMQDPGTRSVFQSLYALPIQTEITSGVLALFFDASETFAEDQSLAFETLTQVATLALSKSQSELLSHSRSEELESLLDICGEVGSAASLESYLQRFVIRVASFLGYRASFIALVEAGSCRIRWASRDGLSRPLDAALDSTVVREVIASKAPFWSNELRKETGIDNSLLLRFRAEQLFAMPLVGSDGECLGILGLLDRLDKKHISTDDARRAKALAGQATIALESARNLDISERHRTRAETLVSFALDLGASVELEDLVKKFTSRGMELLQARSSFMALVRASRPQTAIFQGPTPKQEQHVFFHQLNRALETLFARSNAKSMAMSGERFDEALARELGWRQVIVTPLFGTGNELLAVLGLIDCRRHSASDIELVQAMATHAAAALQNSQLFAQITRSSRQWAEIFDSISDLMLLHDEQQRVVRVNRSLAEKVRKEPSEILGTPVRELFAPSSNLPACPFCLDFAGQAFREEFREPKTGSTYLISSSRFRGNDEGQQTIHVLKDVTASRRVERLYRELFDNIQEGAYFSSPDGRLLEVNDALVRLLGYNSREELLSVAAHKLYVDPAHREIVKRALHQFGRLRNHELALLRRDGSIIYVLENSFVVRDEGGQVVEYRGVLLDITEIKHVQSQLLREHDFNTQILNHTQSLIAVADTAGLVSYANRRCCEVATGNGTDLVGSRLETMVAVSHRPVLRKALESALAGDAVNNLELPLCRENETIGSFSINLSPMRSPGGEVNSLVAVMTDITDVAMLQAKLMHTEKMAAVGQLVSGVAHEVNNPLTAIMGFADLLLESPEFSGSIKDDLRVIIQEAQRTREIVQNLLSFARQTPPQKQSVDLNQVLRRTISLRSYDTSGHGIQIQEEFSSNLPQVIGDAHQLQQVFLNILNNAIDAVRESQHGGRISIETAHFGDSIEIHFRDTGTGIRNPERIFDPFYTTKEVGKGTGLGLSICYGIVREHSGEILCRNNQDSPGATFTIRLPLAQPLRAKAKAAGR
jgi:PAS domain S-box-containing protein